MSLLSSKTSKWRWPLNGPVLDVPLAPVGAFGAIRKYDVHTGVDLYVDPGTPVYPVEPGRVVDVDIFTGPNVGSPWWLETYAVAVEGPTGLVVYGELANINLPEVGGELTTLHRIGEVTRVLKRYKGIPTSMLHLELYASKFFSCIGALPAWRLDGEKPLGLMDPTPYLRKAKPR